MNRLHPGDVTEVVITSTHVSELLRMKFTVEHVFMTLSLGHSDSQESDQHMILTLDKLKDVKKPNQLAE